VLRDGRTVGGGPISELDRPKLIELMVGHALDDALAQAEREETADGRALEVRGLSLPGVFDSIDLDVAAGEIVGLAGLVGAGRSELLEAIFGLRKATGTIKISGRQVSYRRPQQAVRDGVAFVPADRKRQGLVLQMTVLENLMMASTSRVARLRPPRAREEGATAQRTISDLRIHAHSPRAAVSTLSGGNQQKVVLGKWLTTEPKVMMLDEPTRGVDVGAKAEIFHLLLQLADEGMALVMVSEETEELLALVDRVVVLAKGAVAGEFAGPDFDLEPILKSMFPV
jgi:ABC-type sugar transport system ATPase subunit